MASFTRGYRLTEVGRYRIIYNKCTRLSCVRLSCVGRVVGFNSRKADDYAPKTHHHHRPADRQSDSAVINCYRINDVPAHRRPGLGRDILSGSSARARTPYRCLAAVLSEDQPRSDNQSPILISVILLGYCVIISPGQMRSCRTRDTMQYTLGLFTEAASRNTAKANNNRTLVAFQFTLATRPTISPAVNGCLLARYPSAEF